MPCADTVVTGNETNEQYENGKHTEQQNHSDACSPFCNCSCCGITITDCFKGEINTDISEFTISNYYTPIPSFVSMVPNDFWHPPQLG